MQKIKFTIVSCKPTKEGKFLWKLTVTDTAEAFGIVKDFKRTYYIGGMTAAATVGQVIEEDITKFNIVQRPVAVITDATHQGAFTMDEQAAKALGKPYKVIQLSWLHIKHQLPPKAA